MSLTRTFLADTPLEFARATLSHQFALAGSPRARCGWYPTLDPNCRSVSCTGSNHSDDAFGMELVLLLRHVYR